MSMITAPALEWILSGNIITYIVLLGFVVGILFKFLRGN